MIKHGEAPFYECSSRGDKRFSAFFARILKRGNRTIENIYQSSKKFPNGVTGLSWREAKGRKALNQEEVTTLYSKLWDEYIEENSTLLDILKAQSGLSDVFGQEDHCCQATELWRIRNS